MWTRIKAVLMGFKVLDDDGSLSLTSVALVLVLVKVAMAPSLSMEDALLFLSAVAFYSGKKWIRNQGTSTETSEQLASLGQSVEALHAKHTELFNKSVILDNRTTALVQQGRR